MKQNFLFSEKVTIRCCLLFLAILLGLIAGIYWYVNLRDLPFVQRTWLNTGWSGAGPDTRKRMLNDLMQTYKIQEMRTNQIEGLLGTPDSVFTNITLLGKSVATNAEADGLIYWKYYLHCDWTGDELYLNFKINTNGNVIAVYSDD